MRKVLLLVLALAMVACMLTACGDEHEHTYSDEWTVDANNHWHVATCDHTDKIASKGGHVDANSDGACDMCGHGGVHMHTYTDVWTSDATGHWHMATCDGHTEVKGDVYAHKNANGDANCDICGYEIYYTVSVEAHEDITVDEVLFVDKTTGKITFTASASTDVEVSSEDVALVGEPTIADGVATYTFELSGVTANGSINIHGLRTVYAKIVASGVEEGVTFVSGMWGPEAKITKAVTLQPGNYKLVASAGEELYAEAVLLNAENIDVEYDWETGCYNVTEAGEYKVVVSASDWSGMYETADISYAVLTSYGNTAVIENAEGSYVFPAGDMMVTYVAPETGLYKVSTTAEGVQIDSVEGSAFIYMIAGESTEFTVYGQAPEGVYEFDWTIAPATPEAEFVQGENTVVVKIGAETLVSFTAPADGKYSFTAALGSYVKKLNEMTGYFEIVWEEDMIALDEGDKIILAINNYSEESYNEEGILEETVTVTYSQPDTVLTVEVTETNGFTDYYEVTATVSGTYTFWFPEYLGVYTKEAYDSFGMPIVDPFWDYYPDVAEYSVDLAAGDVFAFYVGAAEVGEFEIKYNWVEGDVSTDGGDVSDGEITGTYVGADGMLTVVITDTEVIYTYNHPLMGSREASFSYTYEDGVVTLANNFDMFFVNVENGVVTGVVYEGWEYDVTKSL